MFRQWQLNSPMFCLSILLAGVSTVRCDENIGFSATEPSKGPRIKTPRGYMIAYRQMIPGTEVSFEMAPVPGGIARIQSPSRTGKPGRDSVVEVPVEVSVEPFWLGRCEVTWAEYQQYCDLLAPFKRFERLGVREVTQENQFDAVTAPSMIYEPGMYFPAASDKREWPRHPAAGATQYGAKQYTKWLSKLTGNFYRLPSDVEWEHACRAGSAASFCFGDDAARLEDYAWYCHNSNEDTHPVGLKKPNRWGLYDMHGNVSEWVLDQYSETRAPLRQAIQEGAEPIHWATRLHPRTVRGGSWDSKGVDCRSASRRGSSEAWQIEEPLSPPSPTWLASSTAREIGFRIARPLRSPPPESRGKYWDADVDELKQAVAESASNGHSSRGLVNHGLPAAIKQSANSNGR